MTNMLVIKTNGENAKDEEITATEKLETIMKRDAVKKTENITQKKTRANIYRLIDSISEKCE